MPGSAGDGDDQAGDGDDQEDRGMDTTTAYVLREVDDLDDAYLEAELAAEMPVLAHSSHPAGC